MDTRSFGDAKSVTSRRTAGGSSVQNTANKLNALADNFNTPKAVT